MLSVSAAPAASGLSPGSGVSTTVGGGGGAGVGVAWATATPPVIAAPPSAAVTAAMILFFRFSMMSFLLCQPIWLQCPRCPPDHVSSLSNAENVHRSARPRSSAESGAGGKAMLTAEVITLIRRPGTPTANVVADASACAHTGCYRKCCGLTP